ncbi:MAG: FAD/NAD(P)-binding oxidoreductase [Pseudomonadota bacterium]
MSRIVVIGAGQAGASLTGKLRSLGHEGEIVLLGEEPASPYQRPPLSKKYLLGDMSLDRMYLKPEAAYGAADIDLRLNARVEAVDTAAKEVHVGGEALSYDQLAFTTGSVPRLLPAAVGGDLGGVFAVRTLADVDAMAPAFAKGGHVLIIGGGYIGLEAAAVAAMKGLKATLVEAGPRILGRVAAPETSDFFRDLHTGHGVDIREGVGLTRLTGDGHVSGAELSDGTTLPIDFAIVGIGIDPAAALATAAGLTIDNGIAVDALGQTSVPGVWAAGDCASFPYRGARIRLESVPNAIDQAEVVAANMLGAGQDYVAKPWFWSDQYDLKLQIAGLNTGYDRVVVRDSGAKGRSHWYYQGTELLAVDAMNDARGYMVGKRLIEAGKSPAAEAVADPSADLKAFLKA